MMWSKAAKAALVAVLLVVASTAVAAKGKMGFATEATSSGFISPVLERLKVITVRPGSPAAAAGLRAGDYITEVNGRVIVGVPAREMAGKFKNMQVGQKLLLKVKRGDTFVNVDIVAGT